MERIDFIAVGVRQEVSADVLELTLRKFVRGQRAPTRGFDAVDRLERAFANAGGGHDDAT